MHDVQLPLDGVASFLLLRISSQAEIRGRVKSKQEREADEAAAREAALSASALDASNKGFKMMAKLGFKPGQTLGKTEGARTEPIHLAMKEDRGGVGLDSEKKRKFREQVEHEAKKVKAEEGDYRERLRLEREAKRMEGQIIGAQKVAEKFDTEVDGEVADPKSAEPVEDGDEETVKAPKKQTRPLKSLNILWRGLARHRLEQERERRLRYDLHQSLSRLPTYEDPDEDEDDKRAIGAGDASKVLEEEVEEEDPELEEFNSLEVAERLKRLVEYLRQTYHYCFWCKYQYPDSSMDGCPGLKEEDHD